MNPQKTRNIGPSRREIAERAYRIYEQEGRPQGRDMEHWLRARAELMNEKQQGQGENPQPTQLPAFIQAQAQQARNQTTKRQAP